MQRAVEVGSCPDPATARGTRVSRSERGSALARVPVAPSTGSLSPRTAVAAILAPVTWHFVPADLKAGELAALEPAFATLQERELPDAAAIECWLRDESELMARIGAELARRYIRMTCHTEDASAREAYLAMEQQVMPRVRVLADALDRKFLSTPALDQLDKARLGVLVRRRRTAASIFREANTLLQQEEAGLQARQQEVMGGISIDFEGRPHTLQQLAPYYESQDRALRERAWRAALAARRATWAELETVLDRLVALRTQMGRNAGFDTYTRFRFLELGRFDYTEADCIAFHRAVEQCVVPAVRRLDERRARALGLGALRPWDLEVDPEGRPPLRPFATEPQLVELCTRVFAAVDERFADEFAVLVEHQLLDLMSRKGKAPGGYQYTLEDTRLPFVFVNGVGIHQDVQTLLHEGGHAFHAILSRHFDLGAYRDSPIEFAETASMSMELMGLERIEAAYSAADARYAHARHLESVLRTLPWIASIDAFQHWLYANPQHTHDERRAAWISIRGRFAPAVDWSGLEDAAAMQWIAQGHLFQHAFYYVEYGIAQLAALQVWRNFRRDPRGAVSAYRTALSLGGSRTLPELFAAAGVEFDMGERLMGPLVDAVVQRIDELQAG